MESLSISWLLPSLVTLSFVYFTWKLKNIYSFFGRLGLGGPKPWPVLGSLSTLFWYGQVKAQRMWVKQHGKVCGIFFGTEPRVLIADAEVMQQVCIKDFDAFPNHAGSEFLNKYQKHFLIFLKDDHWRRVRGLMTPTFTSAKIKRMYRLLGDCSQDLVKCFSEQLKPANDGSKELSAVVNCKDIYSLYTLDGIASCCYGLKMQRAGATTLEKAASRDETARICLQVFQFSTLKFIISLCLPTVFLKWIGFETAQSQALENVANLVSRLLKGRRGSTKKFDDYLQLLVDAKVDVDLELSHLDQEENHHAGLSVESLRDDQKKLVEAITSRAGQKMVLSELEILCAAMSLMVVGLETTANLLSHCAYELAFHQDVQEKLYGEVKAIAEYDEDQACFKFDYDSLTSCRYLDAVVSETLRNMPIVSAMDRIAARDYYVEKYDFTIPKGTTLILALYSLMNDPDYWVEPEKFNPERFMTENREKIVPGSYCPFGIGPRHCIGMRFSLTESKLALAQFVMNFRALPAPGTKFPGVHNSMLAFNLVKDPVVKIVPRSQG